jgi:ADP-ribose pyrophosphatase YjhB (NUDIX family)
MPSSVGVGVALIVQRSTHVSITQVPVVEWLLMRRQGKHGAGTWAPPGGWIDLGESPQETAVRELHEECGHDISVSVPVILGFTNDHFDEPPFQSFCVWLRSDWIDGEPVISEPDKITELGWFDRLAFPEPLFKPLASVMDGHYTAVKEAVHV